MIYGLYLFNGAESTQGSPVIYSTDINKLRKVMLKLTNQDTCYVGSPDVTNETSTNSHTKLGVVPYGKIVNMPTLI